MTKTNMIYSIIILVAVCLLVWQNCQKRLTKEEAQEQKEVQTEMKKSTPQSNKK